MIEVVLLLIPLSGMLFIALALAIVLIIRHHTSEDDTPPPTTPTTTEPTPVTIKDGDTYTISKDGTYIKQDFDKTRDKGKMCDAVSTTSKDQAAPFKFTKDGEFWNVATDCDGDGNWTSFLNGSSDLIAARDKDTPKRQQWTLFCDTGGCAFQNRHKSMYLGGTPEKPTFTSTKTLWTVG